jgi:hypothetical protein
MAKTQKNPASGRAGALPSTPDRLSQPSARQAALLVLHLLDEKRSEVHREVTRARLTELTIRKLWNRTRIDQALVQEVQEFLLQAGWSFFWAGSTYAVIKTDAVNGWARISYKRIEDELADVARGKFDFDLLEPLAFATEPGGEESSEDDHARKNRKDSED